MTHRFGTVVRPGAAASPEYSSFLHAAASGDRSTACAQLSAAAQRQVVQGALCEQGITLGAGLYGSVIKQIQITDLSTNGPNATGTARLNGTPWPHSS